ncbi:hypothetical protein PN498_05740 [Oscillatoria sp. CS-180]|nr:hypothetical protein [Oscillatoria sp. CS-180]
MIPKAVPNCELSGAAKFLGFVRHEVALIAVVPINTRTQPDVLPSVSYLAMRSE